MDIIYFRLKLDAVGCKHVKVQDRKLCARCDVFRSTMKIAGILTALVVVRGPMVTLALMRRLVWVIIAY